ncbi:hypothetical protein B0T19DRAFT_436418 [Cercophora scortea]|uniref:BZIP domain-containing protein n=1 Tax=Cercophora scortea TaxID=314031 RepID=A0AAE0J289_9PEZI|nr:hypothetical protein B0T19DRAFT_436418 [Cercophora scortea]
MGDYRDSRPAAAAAAIVVPRLEDSDDDETLRRRSSFSRFWKRSKEVLLSRTGSQRGQRNITFGGDADTDADAGGSSGADGVAATSQGSEPPGIRAPLDKSQRRRAQVRKAQIEHRQRKANYARQLEVDASRIRELIATAQKEIEQLTRENDAIRAQIKPFDDLDDAALLLVSPTLAVDAISPWSGGTGTSPVVLEDITMSLGFDNVTSLPSYFVSSSPSVRNYEKSSLCLQAPGTDAAAVEPTVLDMTPEQTQEAINFILALEHICWNHFHHSDFHPAHDIDLDVEDLTDHESGHTMMATSLALRCAPESVFNTSHHDAQHCHQSPASSQPLLPTATSWQASGLTLHTLHRLASSLTAPTLEITPVQAWFELAARVPMEVLLRREVLDALKREFVGIVRCPHYGAQIERGAYESVVGRVLGGVAGWAQDV